MSTKRKLKIVKGGVRREVEKSEPDTTIVSTTKTEAEVIRDATRTVEGWIADYQKRKQKEEVTAYEERYGKSGSRQYV